MRANALSRQLLARNYSVILITRILMSYVNNIEKSIGVSSPRLSVISELSNEIYSRLSTNGEEFYESNGAVARAAE